MVRAVHHEVGIFAALRRRRRLLSVVLGAALLLNALLATLTARQAVAAAVDPIQAAALCLGADAPAGLPQPSETGQHPVECQLCGPACPMFSWPAADRPATPGLSTPTRPAGGIAAAGGPATAVHSAGLYRSDCVAQAPPAA